MFANIDLAARIEGAEARLIAEASRCVARLRPDRDVWIRGLAGGVASVMAGPSPLNKVAGLGFDGVPSEDELEELESAFSERGVPVQVEVSSLTDPGVVRLLTRRGYELVGFEDVLGLAPGDYVRPSAPGDIRVEVADDMSFETWLDVVVSGFSHPDAQGVASHESYDRDVLAGIVRDMAGAEGFTRLLALRDGVPAGGASLRMDEGIAQLTGAATLPEHRRRGVQTELLHDRLERARRAGCAVAVVTTSPGSKSQENVQHRGFSLLYTRAVLVRE
jgi:GNAT superfamily N-acetyltransferase